MTKRKPAVDIIVSEHARDRARERFPGFKGARIIDEVRAALCDGRVSAQPPDTWGSPAFSEALYLWTEDGERMYAVATNNVVMTVTTCVRAAEAA